MAIHRVRGMPQAGWYPTLIALVLVVEPYARFDIEPLSGGRVVLVTIAVGAVLTGIATRLLGRDRGAAAAGIVIMGLVAATTLPRAAAFATAIALLSLEWWLARRGTLHVRMPWPRITEALNILLAIVLLMQVGRAVQVRIEAPTIPVPDGWVVAASHAGPDVFLILLDGHGRSDVLENSYGYDMAGLKATLGSLDFDEATHSYANHVLTRFSLSVLFNGRPMSEMGQDMSGPVDERLPFAALHTSAAAHLLKTAGYEFTVVASGYEHLGLRGSDRFIDVGPRNEVEQALLADTAVGQVLDRLTAGYFSGVRDRSLLELATLRAIAEEDASRPQFVFAHLPVPHPPVVFRQDCSFRAVDHYTRGAPDRDNRKGDDSAVEATRDQTMCIDRLVAETVADIVADRPGAVVIVLSDHGPEERLAWREPDEPGLRDRLANLFWARTPGRPALFPDDITLVNVLPILFNAYLGTDLPEHPNDLYFGPWEDKDRFVPYTPG